MRSRELLRRLDRLGVAAEKEPAAVHDFSVLSRVERARFSELLYMLRDNDKERTEADIAEFWELLKRCPLVDPSQAGNPYRETRDEREERREFEMSFSAAFHDYARQYAHIAVPNYYNALNEYRLEIGYKLFDKYGWAVGERNCSGISPLDQWEPQDRDALIDLYQRANPENTAEFPAGWKSKYRWGLLSG